MKRRLEGGFSIGVSASKRAQTPAAAGSLRAELASNAPSLGSSELDELTEDERRALRASRFAGNSAAADVAPAADRPQGPGTASRSAARPIEGGAPTNSARAPRLAHPNGPIATNKAAALMRFLERRVNTGATANLDPRLVECAVRNAQQSLKAPAEVIKNVEKFDDDIPTDCLDDLETHGKAKAHASWTSGSKAKKGKKKNHTHGKDMNHKQKKHKKKYI